MNANAYLSIACAAFFLTGCGSSTPNDILSQQFIHKYGLDVSEQEWEQRSKEGQVVTLLKDGVRIVRSYEHGQLHGPTTYSFPHSSVIERLQMYDHGILLKEVLHDVKGVPMREEAYELDNRMIVTLWDEYGTPLSVEKYEEDLLIEGIYYTPGHEVEGKVESGNGERVRRDRSGQLLCRDVMQDGSLIARTSYHPNGQIHTISHYRDFQLHDEQIKYAASGKPLMILHWNHGVLEGPKIIYRNGMKISEIPYVNGQKHGTERHFDDLGTLSTEIEWKNDKKHGPSRFHTDGTTITEWYYRGQLVEAEKFHTMEQHDAFIADLDASLKENAVR
jgi:antitoxin component YwqK of YwqJK toxin-antitoxin module